MDLATARSSLRSKVGNPTEADVSNSTLNRLINDAYREITDKYPFNETRCVMSFDTVPGTDRYQRPAQMSVIRRIWDETNKRKLVKRGPRFMATQRANVPSGKPTSYVFVRDYIHLFPAVDGVYTLNIFGVSAVASLVDDTDTFIIPEAWHAGIVLKARHLFYDERGDIGKAIYSLNAWKDWVSDKPSEIDQEKEDHDDVGVVLPGLAANFRGTDVARPDYRHYPSTFDYTE